MAGTFCPYHAAGVGEFWLIDARRADVEFTINRWQPSGYVADVTPDGPCRSTVFGCTFALVRSRNAAGRFIYDLVAGP